MTLIEIIGNQQVRISVLEEELSRAHNQSVELLRQVAESKKTVVTKDTCPQVGCEIAGPHTHEISGPVQNEV